MKIPKLPIKISVYSDDYGDNHICIYDKNMNDLQDFEYIEYACNLYPEFVVYIQKIVDYHDVVDIEASIPLLLIEEAQKLLKNVKEGI